MGLFYTVTRGGVASAAPFTFTHGLTGTPLVARLVPRNIVVTQTAWMAVATLDTTVATVVSTTGTLQTFDLEVQQIHSIIQ